MRAALRWVFLDGESDAEEAESPEQGAEEASAPPPMGEVAPAAAAPAAAHLGPETHRGQEAQLQVRVPSGVEAGQRLVFTTPDGQQMFAIARQAAPPGSLIPISCRVSAAAAPAPSEAGPPQRQRRPPGPEPAAADKSALASRDARCQKLEQDLREAREATATATARVQELAARCMAAESQARELGEVLAGLLRERERAAQEGAHLVDRRHVSARVRQYFDCAEGGRRDEADAALQEVWRALRDEPVRPQAPPAGQPPLGAAAAASPPRPRRAEAALAHDPAGGGLARGARAAPQLGHSGPAEQPRPAWPEPPEPAAPAAGRTAPTARGRRLDALLAEPVVRRAALAEIAWVGVPEERQRGEAWQLLLGYRPTSRRQQAGALQARRCQYQEMRCGIYEGSSCSSKGGGEAKAAALQQIRVDLPRTEVCRSSPGAAALQAVVDSELVQALMERVLFVWSTQEPAAGYVQGMNDVLLPLLFVLLSERTAAPLAEGQLCLAGVEALPAAVLDEVEADCYWCLTAILRDIVDHYIPGQPGLRHAADLLDAQLREVDAALVEHIATQGADLNIAVMKWLGCLMVRELPVHLCARLWDTCIAESALGARRGFSDFLVGLFVSLLASHGDHLRAAEFDALMEFFLRPPVARIGLGGLDVLISEAFMHMSRMDKPSAAPRCSTGIQAAEHAAEPEPRTPAEPSGEDRRAPQRPLQPADLPPQPHKRHPAAWSAATTSAPTASLLGSTGSRCSGSQLGEDHCANSEGSGPEGRAFSCSSGGPSLAAARDLPRDSAWERPGGATEGCSAVQARKLDTLEEACEAADAPAAAEVPREVATWQPAPCVPDQWGFLVV